MSYLSHHGIKGQKWGVRRYQNKDGTLTAAGRKRQLKSNEAYINAAKKSLKIAEEDLNRTKSARAEDSQKDEAYERAVGNYEGVKSFIKGLKGEPLSRTLISAKAKLVVNMSPRCLTILLIKIFFGMTRPANSKNNQKGSVITTGPFIFIRRNLSF